eukprot:6206185-Pleurochrysis_carterae.AAC.5
MSHAERNEERGMGMDRWAISIKGHVRKRAYESVRAGTRLACNNERHGCSHSGCSVAHTIASCLRMQPADVNAMILGHETQNDVAHVL